MKTNWPIKKLGEVILNIGDGGTPSTKVPEYFDGEIPWVNIEDIQRNIFNTKRQLSKAGLENSSAKLWPKNTIIFSFGASIGNVGIAKTELCTKQGIAGIVPDKSKILTEFLYYVLLKEARRIKEFGQGMGTTIKEVRPSKLLNFVSFLLPPLPLQQKIVKILDSIQGAVGVQEKLIEMTKELKKNLMHKLFREGTKGAKLKKTETPKESLRDPTGQVGEIPEDWEVVKAQDFCKFVTDGTHDTPKRSENGYYLITSKNLKNGKLDFTDVYKISEKDFNEVNKRSKVDQFDVIFGMIGTIGSPILVIDKQPDFAIKNVGLFKNGGDYIKGLYLSYYLDSEKAEKFIKENIGRTTQVYMTLGLLRKFPIAIPRNRNEIEKIAEILQTIDQKIEIEQKKKALYEELFRTMLNKIMNQEIMDNFL